MTTHFGYSAGRPQVWAVGGGKGGTGKSLVAASLAIHLAQMGRRVVLVDGDLGTPNLHSVLGIDPPAVGLADFVNQEVATLDGAAVGTEVPRLRLVSGARNGLDLEQLRHFQKTRLLRLLLGLEADVVLVDLGAGTSLTIMDFFSIADRGLLVILPEPTSIENCYRFLKAAFLRRLQHLGRTLGHQPIIDLVMRHRARAGLGRPWEIMEEIRRVDSCVAETLEGQMEGFLPHLIVNQARDHQDVRLGDAMQIASERFLGIPLRFAGAIPYDPVLVRSVKSRRPYMLEYPRSRTSESFRAAAETIDSAALGTALAGATGLLDPRGAARPIPFPRDPYRILDLPAGAAPAAITEAYMRLRSALRSDSPALLSLDCGYERRAALAEVDEAYRILSRNVSAGSPRMDPPAARSAPRIAAHPFLPARPRAVTLL